MSSKKNGTVHSNMSSKHHHMGVEAAPAWKLHVDKCLEQIGFFNTLIYLKTVNVQVVNELQEVHIKIYTYSNLLSQTLQELLLISK